MRRIGSYKAGTAGWRLRTGVLAVAAGAALAACGMSINDRLTATRLAQSGDAVVVFRVGMAGKTCSAMSVVLGVARDGGGFSVAKTFNMRNGWLADGDTIETILRAGTYHLVGWSCDTHSGRYLYTQTLGKRESMSPFGIGARYARSFASFAVTPGEIINLGDVRIYETAAGTAFLDVGQLPDTVMFRLQKAKPGLVQQMSTRFMTPASADMSPDMMEALCAMTRSTNTLYHTDRPLPAACKVAENKSPG